MSRCRPLFSSASAHARSLITRAAGEIQVICCSPRAAPAAVGLEKRTQPCVTALCTPVKKKKLRQPGGSTVYFRSSNHHADSLSRSLRTEKTRQQRNSNARDFPPSSLIMHALFVYTRAMRRRDSIFRHNSGQSKVKRAKNEANISKVKRRTTMCRRLFIDGGDIYFLNVKQKRKHDKYKQ